MANQKLKDIMDRTQRFRMIYSGVENEKYFKLLYDMGIRDFLMSYHYIHEKKIQMAKYEGLGVKFFIDSGGHTYQNDEKYLEYPVEYWENHLKGYLKWAEENKEYIFAIASFDFENLVDPEVVKGWYRDYMEPFMIRTGIPVCFVWHQNSYASWEEYCERYPYVGFSSVNTEGEAIKLEEYVQKTRIAQKHDSLIHGFGMTRTSILPKVPFYTSDSTTWLVGLQYGEVNYWNGTKMSRLKKEKWKGEYLEDLVSTCHLDRDKFLAEDPIEMIKANVTAFMQAEEYIQSKLYPRMYWLRPDKSKNDVDTFNFPTEEWLQGESEYEGWQEVARLMNINPELDEDDVVGYIIDLCVMIHWGYDDYSELEATFDEDYIKEIYDFYINSVSASHEERIEELQEFFTEVLEGKNDKLLVLGTNFEVKAEERNKYIEEEEFEDIDVPLEEYQEQVQQFLPSPGEDSVAPEIDELDKEIFDQTGYIAVRDDKGRFVKGQKRVRKRKNIYSDKYPKLACNTCYAAQTCPEFKEGYVCAFNKMFKRFDSRNADDVMDAMNSMVNLNMERMQRVAIFEMLDGGIPDSNLTNMIDQNMRLLQQMKEFQQAQEVVRQTRVMRADGTMEQTTHVSSNAPGGVMDMLMKSMMNKSKNNDDEEDINKEL